MTSKVKKVVTLSILGFSALLAVTITNIIKISAKNDSEIISSLFDLQNVKYDLSESAPQNDIYNDNRNGLRLYAYENGAVASYKEGFFGNFNIDLKASTENNSIPNLMTYSLKFTSLTSDDSFKLSIEDKGEELNCYVTINEEKAGITYINNVERGYTTSLNQSGIYTKIANNNSTKIEFDTESLQIKVQDKFNNYYTIWDLSKNVNDGKYIDSTISEMDLYTVDIEFNSIKNNKRADLTIYSINNQSFDSAYSSGIQPLIYSYIDENAVVGNEFILPTPNVFDYDGIYNKNDVEYVIYDGNASEVASGIYSENNVFIPEKNDRYYLLYTINKDKALSKSYYTFDAILESDVTYSFEDISLPSQVGKNYYMHIDRRGFSSNILTSNTYVNSQVSIIKDGNKLNEYSLIDSDFYYTFEETGTYQIVYSYQTKSLLFEADPINVVVSNSIPYIEISSFKSKYLYNDKIFLPEGKLYLDNKMTNISPICIYPSGKEVTEKEITLDEIGVYKLKYEYLNNKSKEFFEKEFTVEYSIDDLFIIGEDTTISYDDKNGSNDYPGCLVTFNTAKSSISYDVNLANNTKDDNLISLYVVSSRSGTHDAFGFYITLTDKTNPNNFITIRVCEAAGSAYNETYIKAKAYNQVAYTGLYKDVNWYTYPFEYKDEVQNVTSHNAGGFLSAMSMGTNNTNVTLGRSIMDIEFDNSERAIYSTPSVNLVHDENSNERKVVDLDDPSYFSTTWSGFDDPSQVRMTITPWSLSNSLQLKILSINGNDFSGNTFEDKKAPTAKIDFAGNEKAPIAKVGTPYKVFDVDVTDNICSMEAINTEYEVFLGEVKYDVANGYFTPDKEGNYTIKYYVKDAYGNTSFLTTNVTAKNNVDSVSTYLDGKFPSNLTFGEIVTLPNINVTGGTGVKKIYGEVICEGEEIEIDNFSFQVLKEGNYTLRVYAEDYIGQKSYVEKKYEVEFSNDFVFDESIISLPNAFVDGIPYEFNDYEAIYFPSISEGSKTIKSKIEIVDGNGTTLLDDSNIFVPKSDNNGLLKVRYIFEESTNGQTNRKIVEKEVAVIKLSNTNTFMKEFFTINNAELTVKNQYMTIEAIEQNKDTKIEFVRPINTDELTISMNANQIDDVYNSNFEYIKITLVDSKYSNIKIEAKIINTPTGLLFALNNGQERYINGSLTTTSTTNIQFNYYQSTKTIYGSESCYLGVVDKTIDGKKFDGFTNNQAFVSIELVGVNGPSAINLLQINNQRIIKTIKDTGSPQLFIDGSYSGMYTSNSLIEIPTARAYDVLSYASTPVLSIKAPDGTYIKSTDGIVMDKAPANRTYEIKPTEIGRYVVSYETVDSNGVSRDANKSIVIYDDILPEIELKEALPEKVYVGTTITIPEYVIKDNGDVSKVLVIVYYRGPSGLTLEITNNEFTPNEKGNYVVSFYLVDENDNYNVVSYEIKAFERQNN